MTSGARPRAEQRWRKRERDRQDHHFDFSFSLLTHPASFHIARRYIRPHAQKRGVPEMPVAAGQVIRKAADAVELGFIARYRVPDFAVNAFA